MGKQSSDWTIIQDGGWNRTRLNKMKFSDWPKFKFKFSLMFNCFQLKAYKG